MLGCRGGMCGKTGKVFYKTGNLGDRSSTPGLRLWQRVREDVVVRSLVSSSECVWARRPVSTHYS